MTPLDSVIVYQKAHATGAFDAVTAFIVLAAAFTLGVIIGRESRK